MLIGTALLSAIDVLKSHDLFCSNSNTEVRNLGLILCHYLHFALLQRECCRQNEAGWTEIVIQRAQEQGVRIEGFYGMEDVLEKLKASTTGKSTDATNVGIRPRGGKLNMIHAYEAAPPMVGLLTLELLRAHEEGGTRRGWSRYDIGKEVRAYRRHQMVKVGEFGPEDYGGSSIGGKFYDLIAPRNRGLVGKKMHEATIMRKELEAEGDSSD